MVLVVQHRLQNIVELNNDFLARITKETGVPFPKKLFPGKPQTRPREDSLAITNYLKKLGYDGVKLNGEIVAFDPSKLSIVKVVSMEDSDFLT